MSMSASVFLLAGCVDYSLRDPDRVQVDPVEVVETFSQVPLPGLDLLLVVDATGSMAEEQAGLAAGAAGLVDALDALDLAWQIGVTSADPAVAGALLGRPWIVTASAADPGQALADALLAAGTASPPPAAGLDAATLALLDADGLNAGFRRDAAALHVVFVADGDDESGDVLGDDPVASFLAVLDEEATRTGRAAVASAVVGDVPDGCAGVGGRALAGVRYAEVAEAAGGEVVSICSANLPAVVEALGSVGVEWTTVFPLQADPEGDVDVEVDGERVSEGWSIDHDAPALVFAEPPAAGAAIVVRYTLREGG